MQVVVVESPAKAKTINKYLGGDFTVLASFGHVRDLPSKEGSVLPDDDFAMSWEVDAKSAKRLKDIADAVRDADALILATDPDREGEAISWHILEALAKKRALKDKLVKRVVFNAITKSAVLDAMAAPRDVDMELVEAYLARRALDYLVGFTLSPVLWRKLPGAKSAGRVQSVALRLITEREMEIEAFTPQEFWTVDAEVDAGTGPFQARLTTLDGKKLKKFDLGDEAAAKAAVEAVKARDFAVATVEAKPTKRHPAPPFTTSTLQQEAARKLGFDAKRTMQGAQKLYEGVDIGGETVGLITYMRTDGVSMAGEAIGQARRVLGDRFGADYVPEKPRMYSTKAKNAQEAHEAVRPTSFGRAPGSLRLDGDLAKLYDLIWKRALASQAESARLERTTIDIASKDGQAVLRATGSVILFDGFIKIYEEGRDDTADEKESRLPEVKQGAPASVEKHKPEQHFTQPPPRFSEASLVKRLEELGIGRPSTYASILSVLREREYVRMEQKRFLPEDKGRLVTAFLEQYFRRYVEYDFTADLEEKLDKVSAGELSWKALLRAFWAEFSAATNEAGELKRSEVIDAIDAALAPHVFPAREDGADPRICPLCADGRLSLKAGKWGAFIGCSNYPECKYTRQLGQDPDAAPAAEGALGTDPDTGLEIALKSGRFGPYVQRGEGEERKMAGLPKGWEPADVTLEKALLLLSLPREVGLHPEDGQMIQAGLGRYGPFVSHTKDGAAKPTYATLSSFEEVFEVGLNRAVSLLAEKRAGAGRRPGQAPPLKELGPHPETGQPIAVMSGRYGPYVKHGKTNATLPKGVDPEGVTLDVALPLLAAKEAKSGGKAPTKAKSKAGAKSTTKAKSTKSKSTAKSKAKPAASEGETPKPKRRSAKSSGDA